MIIWCKEVMDLCTQKPECSLGVLRIMMRNQPYIQMPSACLHMNCQYEQLGLEDKLLMELQSVGLYPETVVCKKEHLDNLNKAVEEGKGVARMVAMDRLVEWAHRKQLATRGNNASKFGVPKVSKQVSLAFTRRTLAKCRKFEDTGKSCFCEPPFEMSFLLHLVQLLWSPQVVFRILGLQALSLLELIGMILHNDKFGRGVH
ncbi:hypothetical protein NC651_019198 [Populus alba x Populus x berolinensis]|nr:hypothetical protein NC651_019198 [Populus alba x Populus x berolinensis]